METPPTPPPAKKPWPMKWIVLAIAVYVVGYTVINISYRKPAGAAHEPYAEAREQRRMRSIQVTNYGWSRVACELTQPGTALSGPAAEISAAPLPARLDRHLPPELVLVVPRAPALHPAGITLSAPARVDAEDSLRLVLDFPVDASVPAFGETLAYFKDNQLFLFLQDQRHVAPDSQPTPAASPLALVLPPATLTPGTWQASAFSASQAFTWSFTVE